MTDPLAEAVVAALGRDPTALAQLRELVADSAGRTPAAYSVRTLAAELGRSERSIRGAIHRGELDAVKRGRAWIVSADAVEAWARSPLAAQRSTARHRRASRGPGVMARALTP